MFSEFPQPPRIEGRDWCTSRAMSFLASLSIHVRRPIAINALRNCFWWAICVLGISVAAIGAGGCRKPESGDSASKPAGGPQQNSAVSTVSLPPIPAGEYLQQVFSRYRSTSSYQDQGEVWLRVERDGRVIRNVAPMEIRLDGAKIWIAAYDARLWSDDERTLGWVVNDETKPDQHQVVVGASATDQRSTDRPVLANLLRDPLLTSRMTSGLGGPPPQLEWLLDAKPMARLFQPQSTIEYEGTETEREHPCVVVRATAGEETYRFWIDRSRSLVRRVSLPVSIAGTSVELDGWTVKSLELVLMEARFSTSEPSQDTDPMPQSKLPPRPTWVRALVPLPPRQPSRYLGSRLESFQVTAANSGSPVSHLGAGTALTLWLIPTKESSSERGAAFLRSIYMVAAGLGRLDPSLLQNVRPIALTDDKSLETLSKLAVEDAGWILIRDPDHDLASRLKLRSGQMVLSDSSGTLLWIGSLNSPTDSVVLPNVISDALAGVDIVRRLRDQWKSDFAAYQKKLTEVTITEP